jgi:hypothetical protein
MRPVRTAGAIALAFFLLGAATLRAEAPPAPSAAADPANDAGA